MEKSNLYNISMNLKMTEEKSVKASLIEEVTLYPASYLY